MIFNVTGGGAGSGGTLVVTAPAGVTCTVSKDGKTKTKTVDQYGYATFKGLDTGTWTVTISDGSETATATVEIVADYAKTMTFFAATITVTFPEGSTCTCSDGNTTLTAPTTSGSYTFTVPNAGTWTVSCTDGSDTDSATVTITTDGESQSVELVYDLLLYNYGDEYTDITGGWTINSVGSKESDYIIVGSTTAGYYDEYATHAKSVDLTDKTTVRVYVLGAMSTTSNGIAYIKICNTSGTTVASTKIFSGETSFNDKLFTVDVSSLEGSYFIVITASTGSAGSKRVAYVRFGVVRCV